VIKSRRVIGGRVECMGKKRKNTYKILVVKPEGNNHIFENLGLDVNIILKIINKYQK
jgi:hypothetical protein